jgi:hypothetical protein
VREAFFEFAAIVRPEDGGVWDDVVFVVGGADRRDDVVYQEQSIEPSSRDMLRSLILQHEPPRQAERNELGMQDATIPDGPQAYTRPGVMRWLVMLAEPAPVHGPVLNDFLRLVQTMRQYSHWSPASRRTRPRRA